MGGEIFGPLITVGASLIAFFVCYGIAVGKDHVDAWLPYISDCGNLPPESCIFTMLCAIASFAWIYTVYSLHLQVIHRCGKNGALRTFAYFVFFLGFLSAIGYLMVASFQEGHVLDAHNTGAFMFFFGFVAYCFGYYLICFYVNPQIVSMPITVTRVLFNLIVLAVLIFHMICLFGSPFVKDVNGLKPDQPDFSNGIERYNEDSPFYNNHIATTLSEWVLAMLMLLEILSFSIDLWDSDSYSQKPIRDDGSEILGFSETTRPGSGPIMAVYDNQGINDREMQDARARPAYGYETDNVYRRGLPRVSMNTVDRSEAYRDPYMSRDRDNNSYHEQF
ncbi:unnamed protein product, partial [Mesorhabditis belari]|uniref:CWH43-like N-terminal domain-containing protein n=1 Tax=Mesorhabditis belari TaxID=2138241 RepID=A0AAF3FB09_9BILA